MSDQSSEKRPATCTVCGHVYEVLTTWDPEAVRDFGETWNSYVAAITDRKAPTTDGYCTQAVGDSDCDGRVRFADGTLFWMIPDEDPE